jgi:hypothetical protein
MCFEPMNSRFALVLDPAGVIIAFAGGCDDGGVDDRFTRTPFAFNCNVTASNRVRSSLAAMSALRNRTKVVRSGVGSVLEKPQNRRNDARSASASASLTSDRSYQTDSSSALTIATAGHAASPLALAWIALSKAVIGCQSIRSDSSSKDEQLARNAVNPSRS